MVINYKLSSKYCKRQSKSCKNKCAVDALKVHGRSTDSAQ